MNIKKYFIFLVFVFVFSSFAGADAVIVRGLYEGYSEIILKYSGADFSETQKLHVQNTWGIGMEYEHDWRYPLNWSVGLDYFIDRPLLSNEYSGDNSSGEYRGTALIYDAYYQTTELFGRLKFYISDAVYLGGQLSLPFVALHGSYWHGAEAKAQVVPKFIVGVAAQNIFTEFVFSKNVYTFSGVSDLQPYSNQYMIALNCGVVFSGL